MKHKICAEYLSGVKYLIVYEKSGFFSGWRYLKLFHEGDIEKARKFIKTRFKKGEVLEYYVNGK